MTTGSVGGSKVRSPSPSATKTIAFCSPPFESTTTSLARNGAGCCLAQLGSADMLIGLGAGTAPVNLTMPLIAAAPALVGGEGGLPAFTTWRPEMPIISVRAITRREFLIFILHLG